MHAAEAHARNALGASLLRQQVARRSSQKVIRGMDKVSANSYHKPCSYELRLAYYYFAQ